MKIKVILILLLLSLNSQVSFGQKLLALFEIKESYLDSVDRALIIPKYHLKEDTSGRIFYQNELIFKPVNDFKHSIYQIFAEKFLVISALNEKSITSNLRYLLPKNNLIIIDLENGKIIYKGNVKNKYIYDIYYDIDNVLIIELANYIERIVAE